MALPASAGDGAVALGLLSGSGRRNSHSAPYSDDGLALRWTGAAMLEAAKGFRRLKAHKQLPILRAALAAYQAKYLTNLDLEQQARAA